VCALWAIVSARRCLVSRVRSKVRPRLFLEIARVCDFRIALSLRDRLRAVCGAVYLLTRVS
jgi:hypothetical protein